LHPRCTNAYACLRCIAAKANLLESPSAARTQSATDFFPSIESHGALAHNPPVERPDDFDTRRARLRGLSDDELHARFWSLAEQIVAPLIAEARTHTTPSIERSVLLRMGFSSIEAKTLVGQMQQRQLLGHGAGRLVLHLAKRKHLSVRAAGTALLDGRYWDEIRE
jgi:D-ornithine 4,5-aminomutase subunit alpha